MDVTELDVRYFDVTTSKTGLNSKRWPLKDNIIYAEDLAFDLLDELGVGPVYRYLFAIRYVNEEIWLAPDHNIRNKLYSTVVNRSNKKRKSKTTNQESLETIDQLQDVTSSPDSKLNSISNKITNQSIVKSVNDKPIFELRMRFKPTFLGRLTEQDSIAMNLIYSQLRYDFIHMPFRQDNENSNNVLMLIFYDMIRYSIDYSKDFNDVMKHDIQNFIPKTRMSWILPLMVPHATLMKNKIEGTTSNKDSREHKRKFIEMLLVEVWKDYGCELYEATFTEKSNNPKRQAVRVRVRLNLGENTACIIDSASILLGLHRKTITWNKICDIDDVSYGSVDGEKVDIDRANDVMVSLEFNDELRAKSFLSSIHGYYRLMKKWNMDITKNLSSPTLRNLLRKQIHGPIGSNLVIKKLAPNRVPGYYLIRQCILSNNTYYVDVLITKNNYCSICFEKKSNYGNDEKYLKINHEFWPKNRDYELVMKESNYDSIDKLLEDIQIKIPDSSDVQPLVRVRPNENDNCFSLLICMSPVRLMEINNQDQLHQNSQLLDLPKIIPMDKISFTGGAFKSSNNKMVVRSGILKYSDKSIIYKFPETVAIPTERPAIRSLHRPDSSHQQHQHKAAFRLEGVFISTKLNSDQVPLLQFVQLESNRILDWIYVKHPLFAESIGVELSRCAFIQECFPEDRRLDLYLNSLKARWSMPHDLSNLAPCQLAEALEYLETKNITHGKIRCHNIFIKSFEPFRICITDPLGTFDYYEERAFIPQELFITDDEWGQQMKAPQELYPNRLRPGLDIWAFATTLWQIYNWGERPPAGIYASYLQKPDYCSESIWSLMQCCWLPDPNRRPTALSICRDLKGIFANFYDGGADDVYIFPDYVEMNNGYDHHQQQDQYMKLNGNCFDNLTNTYTETNQRDERHHDSESSTNNNSETLLANSSSSESSKNEVEKRKKPLLNLINKIIQWNQASGSSQMMKQSNGYDNLSRASTHSNSERTAITTISGLRSSTRSSISRDNPNNMNLAHDKTTYEITTDNCPVNDKGDQQSPLATDCDLIQADRLVVESEIGRGSSGVVRRAKLTLNDGETVLVAVKFVINPNDENYTKLIDELKAEHAILKDITHKNIVKTFGITNDRVVKMVVEYLPMGSLLSFIRNSVNMYTRLPLKKYAQDIAEGMEYLESKKIIHRDLALRNVLMKSPTQVKICDFGLAHRLKHDDYYRIQSLERAIPWKWCPPETYTNWVFSLKSDVWSFGIVLWEIYSGGLNPQYPATMKELPSLFERGERLARPKHCPHDTYDLMMKCWALNPEDRPTFQTICQDIALNNDPLTTTTTSNEEHMPTSTSSAIDYDNSITYFNS